MNYDPVEGVHYIFDRYKFLNQILEDGKFQDTNPVSPGSTFPDPEGDIKRIIKLARAMYHPDRQQRSGEKMQREAERMSQLIDDCERFLTNPDLKAHYDAKLAEFVKDTPNLVSANGNAIIDVNAEILDINSLLSDDVMDTRDFEDRIKALLQYDEKNTLQAKSLFDAMGDNAQIRDLYRTALTKKLVYLTLLEDAAWAKVGVMNRKNKIDGMLKTGDEYLEKIEDALKQVSTAGIDAELNKRGDSARIGLSKLPLLLSFNPAADGSAPPAPGPQNALMDAAEMQQVLDKMKLTARQNFEIRAEYVRDVSRQKQDILCAVIALTPVTALNAQQADNPLYSFYLANAGEDGQVILRLDLDVSTGDSGIGEIFHAPLNVADLKLRSFDRNALLVERNPEISDILVEVTGAAERVFQDHKHRFDKPDPVPAPPQP